MPKVTWPESGRAKTGYTVEHVALTTVLCILSVLQRLAIHLLPGDHN